MLILGRIHMAAHLVGSLPKLFFKPEIPTVGFFVTRISLLPRHNVLYLYIFMAVVSTGGRC